MTDEEIEKVARHVAEQVIAEQSRSLGGRVAHELERQNLRMELVINDRRAIARRLAAAKGK